MIGLKITTQPYLFPVNPAFFHLSPSALSKPKPVSLSVWPSVSLSCDSLPFDCHWATARLAKGWSLSFSLRLNKLLYREPSGPAPSSPHCPTPHQLLLYLFRYSCRHRYIIVHESSWKKWNRSQWAGFPKAAWNHSARESIGNLI